MNVTPSIESYDFTLKGCPPIFFIFKEDNKIFFPPQQKCLPCIKSARCNIFKSVTISNNMQKSKPAIQLKEKKNYHPKYFLFFHKFKLPNDQQMNLVMILWVVTLMGDNLCMAINLGQVKTCI
jgi:hypothetical protein